MSNDEHDEDEDQFGDIASTAFGHTPSYLSDYSGPGGDGRYWRGFLTCMLLSFGGLFLVPLAMAAVVIAVRAAVHRERGAWIAVGVAIACTAGGVYLLWFFAGRS